jgi:type 1 glutamine amidotransferase
VRIFRLGLAVLFVACSGWCVALSGAPAVKRLLIIGEEKGYRHEAVSHAAATIERLGRESGLWSTTIRTDTEALTKKKLEYNAKNLNDFDAVLFYTGGELEMNGEQKAALLSFVRDDGKGFIGVHSAAITFADWPEYREMIGGFYDEHPWLTFDAPIVVEDANFPGMQQWPKEFVLKDEIYQMKDWSRGKVRVLMRLDSGKIELKNPQVHRKDRDFAVAWAKMYGKGRVYYSTLGHVEQNWDDPRLQQMYVGAIKWAIGLVDADVTPRALSGQTAGAGNHERRSVTVSEELRPQ